MTETPIVINGPVRLVVNAPPASVEVPQPVETDDDRRSKTYRAEIIRLREAISRADREMREGRYETARETLLAVVS